MFIQQQNKDYGFVFAYLKFAWWFKSG